MRREVVAADARTGPARVSVPITLVPYVHVGDASTWCCGKPAFHPVCDRNEADSRKCTFIVSQMMCVSAPITFNVDACAGEADIECLDSPCDGEDLNDERD